MTAWNSASWVRFFSCCGWSAQAKWLITICGSKPSWSIIRLTIATSLSRKPSRFMPVSKWSAAGSGLAARDAERQPLLEHRQRGEARHQPVLGVDLGGAGEEAVEDEDVRVGHRGRARASASSSVAVKKNWAPAARRAPARPAAMPRP